MRAPKKIRPDKYFLDFVKEHYNKQHREVWEPLFENRQQYFEAIKNCRTYNFEAMEMKELAKKLGVSVKSLKDCVTLYLFG